MYISPTAIIQEIGLEMIVDSATDVFKVGNPVV